jgi:hypothetical protein
MKSITPTLGTVSLREAAAALDRAMAEQLEARATLREKNKAVKAALVILATARQQTNIGKEAKWAPLPPFARSVPVVSGTPLSNDLLTGVPTRRTYGMYVTDLRNHLDSHNTVRREQSSARCCQLAIVSSAMVRWPICPHTWMVGCAGV